MCNWDIPAWHEAVHCIMKSVSVINKNICRELALVSNVVFEVTTFKEDIVILCELAFYKDDLYLLKIFRT